MGYPGNNGITWKELQAANIQRLPEFKNKHGELAHSKTDGSDWSPAQWLQAVIGELGEYANIRKKFERGDISLEDFNRTGGYELADTIIYLSILAYRLEIDLDEAVREKFNIVSERVGSRVYIGSDWEYHLKKDGAVVCVKQVLTHYGLFRPSVPESPMIKEAGFFISQGGLKEEWGNHWEPIYDCETVGDARRKFAKSKGVNLSHIYWSEQ